MIHSRSLQLLKKIKKGCPSAIYDYNQDKKMDSSIVSLTIGTTKRSYKKP